MNRMTVLDLARRTTALQTLAAKRREDMKRRWPEIDFDANVWPIRTRYKTKLSDVRCNAACADFAGRDRGYLLALRCLFASCALKGKNVTWERLDRAWRLLAVYVPADVPLAALSRYHLNELEVQVTRDATISNAYPKRLYLNMLAAQLDYLAREGVLDRFLWNPSMTTHRTLNNLSQQRKKELKQGKAEILDRQIEAFAEATSAMLRQDERLDQIDRSVIALTNIFMCAPSRVNEALNLKIGDRFSIDHYAVRSEDRDTDSLHSAHQLLLMKGSKGAVWSPKPVLNFMIELLEQCWQIILDAGKRSRMLVNWYEQNPGQLYLPPVLEHLRGNVIDTTSLWQIVNLTSSVPNQAQLQSPRAHHWKRIVKSMGNRDSVELMIDNPKRSKRDRCRRIKALYWWAVEGYILKEVHQRMEKMRHVTISNHYYGPLSEMLVLFDQPFTPYLPDALDFTVVGGRLGKRSRCTNVFSKLGLRMSQGGREVDCYLHTHDPRRWLTTQALAARERLSDVLINKWANRLSLAQLQNYDLRSDEQKAEQSAIPLPAELEDMSRGLQDLDDQASQYGLATEIVVAHGHGISVTSMDAVCQATQDRPVARTGGNIIILYPTRFGACVHQHHEVPCRSYVCGPCREQRTVKGHLPTNEEWRKEQDLTYRSIVNQLQALVMARNRGVADDPQMLDAHLVTLVKEGLDPQGMADELIDRFHEIKHQIRDLSFRNELEQAFVARGVVKRLDNPDVPSGALIKYNNPKRHAAPGHELAIEAQYGSREEMDRQSEFFYQQHPELAPANLRLQDEGHLLADDDDEGLDDD
jgi:hypothetical protein